MAIKVVRDKPDKSVIKRKVCNKCGVTLEYAPVDVKERHGTDYGGGPDGTKWIVCPKCNNLVILESW